MFTLLTFLPEILYFSVIMIFEPHDCFICFSRIGQGRYSLFQYTALERNRIYEQQIGEGAVRMHKELYLKAVKKPKNKQTDLVVIGDGNQDQSEVEASYKRFEQRVKSQLNAMEQY